MDSTIEEVFNMNKRLDELSIKELNNEFWVRGTQINVARFKGELCFGLSSERF